MHKKSRNLKDKILYLSLPSSIIPMLQFSMNFRCSELITLLFFDCLSLWFRATHEHRRIWKQLIVFLLWQKQYFVSVFRANGSMFPSNFCYCCLLLSLNTYRLEWLLKWSDCGTVNIVNIFNLAQTANSQKREYICSFFPSFSFYFILANTTSM